MSFLDWIADLLSTPNYPDGKPPEDKQPSEEQEDERARNYSLLQNFQHTKLDELGNYELWASDAHPSPTHKKHKRGSTEEWQIELQTKLFGTVINKEGIGLGDWAKPKPAENYFKDLNAQSDDDEKPEYKPGRFVRYTGCTDEEKSQDASPRCEYTPPEDSRTLQERINELVGPMVRKSNEWSERRARQAREENEEMIRTAPSGYPLASMPPTYGPSCNCTNGWGTVDPHRFDPPIRRVNDHLPDSAFNPPWMKDLLG